MKKILNSYYFFIILYIVLLIISLVPYYSNGQVILGQEGNNFLDFSVYLGNYRDTWQTIFGVGTFNTSVNSSFPNIYFLVLLQKLIGSKQIVNFILIFLIYFLPFLAIFQVCKTFKIRSFITFLVSLFYIVNPFTLYYLSSNLNHCNVLILAAAPLFFWLILKFYHDNFKLFFFFGFTSLMFSFVHVNPPLMVINQISIILSIIIISYFYHENISLIQMFKKYLTVFTSFFLFNFWWIINWLYIFLDVQQGYTKEFALSWLRGSGKFIPLFWKTFNLIGLLTYPLSPEYDFFNKYYAYTPIFMSIPILLVVIYFLLRKKRTKKYQLILGLLLMTTGFLVKGVNGLFGSVYGFMVMKLPFFSIFKTAGEKWGVLFIFLLTLYLIVIFKELEKNRFYHYTLVFFIIYIVYCSIPLVTSNFIPDYKSSDLITGSRKFKDKIEYQSLRKELNNGPEQYRALSLPGSWNYQVALQIEGKKFYTGLDPVVSNINKPFITPYSGSFTQRFGVLFDEISHPDYLNFLGFFNVKKIVINKDMYPWFGFRGRESIFEIEEILDKKLKSSKNEVIDIYDVGDYYLPRFYVPQELIYSSNNTQDNMPDIISAENFLRRTALFINPYEETSEGENFESDLVKENSSQIVVIGDIQSAGDEKRLRAGVKGMNPGGVLFPYARWKPGSIVYPFLQKKEQSIKNQFLDQPEKMFEQHLFFAAKRITEIQKWDKSLTEEQFVEVLARYKNEMQAAIENLNAVRQTGKESFMLLVKIEVSFEAHQKLLLDVLKGDYGRGSTRTKLAEAALTDIDNQLKEILKGFSQIKYYFEIPQSGEYEILVENSGISPECRLEDITSEVNDKFIASASAQLTDGKWLSFGKKRFKQGEHWLEFIQPDSQNLLTKNWQKLESKIEIDEENKLSAGAQPFTIYHDIKNWQPRTVYKLSFKYKIGREGRLKVLLIEEKEKVDTTWFDKGVINEPPTKFNILVEEQLKNKDDDANKWQDFSVVVNSDRNAKVARLSIKDEENDPKQINTVMLKDIQLETITELQVILRKVDKIHYFEIPKITFQKINPTKYIINVEDAVDPYFLVFSESFHRGWKAYINGRVDHNGKIVGSYFDGEIKEKEAKSEFFDRYPFQTWRKKPLADDQHIVMNGYANSWYITPEDADGQTNYQIVIEYWSQRLFYIGVLVTLATIIITLTISFWGKLKPIRS